jgi:hypothetical protein
MLSKSDIIGAAMMNVMIIRSTGNHAKDNGKANRLLQGTSVG